MNQVSLMRRESQPKGLSSEEKSLMVQQLLRLVEYQEPFNVIHTLFGYLLGSINAQLNDKFIFQLKKKFEMMQQLFLSRMIEREGITLIVVDCLQNFRRQMGSSGQKQGKLLQLLSYSTEETMVNQNFIYEKWMNQSKIDQQNKENELAFKKFLEEEAAENKMKAEQIEGQGWECPVCMTDIDRDRFGILECSHIFHPECIGAYLKAKIEEGETDILCPMEGCKTVLDVGDIYQYSDPDLKEKFQKFSFNKFIEKNNKSTAWCPTAGCTAAFEFDEELDNYRCPACSNHYCLRCRCIYHNGMTCAEYKINNSFDKNDQDFINFVKGAKYKQCPKCNYWVQRNDGCSTMTCKCGQQFCYECGGTTCPHGMCAKIGIVPKPIPGPRPVVARPLNNRKRR